MASAAANTVVGYLWPRLSDGGAARLLRRPMRTPRIKAKARTPTPEPIHAHAGKPLSSVDEPAAVFPPAELLAESDEEALFVPFFSATIERVFVV